MSGRYDVYVEQVRVTVIEAAAQLSVDVRRAIVQREPKSIPTPLVPYVLKVALHAYKVEDEDIIGLKRDGRSEDEIFEATVAAAVGAALLRLDRGMAALRAAPAPAAPAPAAAARDAMEAR